MEKNNDARVIKARKHLGPEITNYLYGCLEVALEDPVHQGKRNLHRIEGVVVAMRLAGKISEDDYWVLHWELEAPIRQALYRLELEKEG